MGCTNPTAPITLVPGSPVNLYPPEFITNSFSSSSSPVQCNTGGGACGQTSPGTAAMAWTMTRTKKSIAGGVPLYVSARVVPSGENIGDWTELQNSLVGTMTNVGDSVPVSLSNQSLGQDDKLCIVVWFAYTDPNLPGLTYPAIAGIATMTAAFCS